MNTTSQRTTYATGARVSGCFKRSILLLVSLIILQLLPVAESGFSFSFGTGNKPNQGQQRRDRSHSKGWGTGGGGAREGNPHARGGNSNQQHQQHQQRQQQVCVCIELPVCSSRRSSNVCSSLQAFTKTNYLPIPIAPPYPPLPLRF